MDDLGYIALRELAKRFGNVQRGFLRCFHLNVQSLGNKVNELECLFNQMKGCFDVVMLTETWKSDISEEFELPHMKTFSVFRPSRRGGGVTMLLENSLPAVLLEKFTSVTAHYEMLCVQFQDVIVAVCYRPPDGDLSDFFAFLDVFLTFVNQHQYTVILGGDFNIDMGHESTRKCDFETIIACNGCENIINRSTRISLSSETTIDLFITNCDLSCVTCAVLTYPISDHMAICCSVKTAAPTLIQNDIPYSYQHVSPAALDAFRLEIGTLHWDNVFYSNDANSAYDAFLESFICIYKKHFPYKQRKKRKGCRKPWMTRELLRKIDRKNRLFRKFIRTRDEADLIAFKQFRNALSKEMKKSKELYHIQAFTVCSKRADVLWNRINSLMGRNSKTEEIKEVLHDGNLVSGEAMVNVFNDYFVYRDFSDRSTATCRTLGPEIANTFFLAGTIEPEVRTVFLGLKNSRSCDADGIQIKPVKYVIDQISPALTHIFNLCISTGVFPSKMQTARVIALYKKGNKHNVANYRPISILPVFSKGFEKIIFSRLSCFCTKYVLTKSQYGFQKHKSTELALLDQKEYILQQFEQKNKVVGIFVDFTQAFDYIHHGILFEKLNHYGIRGLPLMLLKSYLAHRCQFVSINDLVSDKKNIISGVPQGSILGPLLFTLYINDIVHISPEVKFIIYADDTSIFVTSSSDVILSNKANDVLQKLDNWTSNNKLKINATKTKAVVFHSKGQQVTLKNNIVFRGSDIEIVKSVKVLGVHFSSSLQWDDHVNNIQIKLGRITGILSRIRYLIPNSVKLLIYKSLFSSYLNYCYLVWGTTTETNLTKLLRIQKKILRLIDNATALAPSDPLFKKYKIIKVNDLYQYRLLREYCLSCKRANFLFTEMANLCLKEKAYETRNTEMWNVPYFRTNYGFQMLRCTLPRILNTYISKGIDVSHLSVAELAALFVL